MSFLNDMMGKAARAAAGSVAPQAAAAVKGAAQAFATEAGAQEISFPTLPASLEAFRALPQASMATPFDTAALTVLALSLYPENKELSLAALDVLRGPRPMSGIDKQFIADRFMDKKDYVPRSYFNGATPQNNYTPFQPWTVRITAGPYAYQNEGYAKLDLRSGGADSPRSVQLRKAKDGKWYLWDQFLLPDIRKPESEDPWA